MNDACNVPKGELILRTLAMPEDTNPSGDIFGGWILSQMDMAGGIMSKEIAKSRTVTVAVDSMKFIRPVKVGDVVCCYGSVVNIGTTSITLDLEVWVETVLPDASGHCPSFKVTEANFVFVALNEKGQPRPVREGAASNE